MLTDGIGKSSTQTTITGTPEDRARAKMRKLWQNGDLFHVATRYPRKRVAGAIDRLAGILRHGLLAPAYCEDGSVISDLNLTVVGCEPPYDTFVFLHRFGPPSWVYTISEPGRFAVFIDRVVAVKAPEEMGDAWPELSQDEVYVHGRIDPEHVIGVAVHPDDAPSVLAEFVSEFRRLAMPLYDYGGNVLWPIGDRCGVS